MLSHFRSFIDRDRSSHFGATANSAKQKVEAGHPKNIHALIGDEPPRTDGSDRFFGLENIVGQRADQQVVYLQQEALVGFVLTERRMETHVMQSLFHHPAFREYVVNFPFRGQPPYQPKEPEQDGSSQGPPERGQLARLNTEPLPTTSAAAHAAARARAGVNSPGGAIDAKKKPLPSGTAISTPTGLPENKDSPEFKKKKAMENGPILEIDQLNNDAYGMDENLFAAMKDIFESIMASSSRTGVVRPNKFLEILRKRNEMFSGNIHQDAHEFLNFLLNEIIENVDAYTKKVVNANGSISLPPKPSVGSFTPLNASSTASTSSLPTSTGSTRWIHDLFEGQLTSETKCLTCETVSRRDEKFLDLSIDLEKNSSVTSCLRNFSASEMLCERNKFHCDTCGGLQEAEKRMKVKKLPKLLALHLKRFKYMEQAQKFEKLHYRVLYPYHLRLFNTTDDAVDPDRLYELYAVVVHIGGGPYHGHYVAIVKTPDKGWLLFDDEMVEPVSKEYVLNFFGERHGNGVASAYLLFYQETTFEAVQREQWADLMPKAGTPDSLKAEQVKPKISINSSLNEMSVNGSATPPDALDLASPKLPPNGRRASIPPASIAAEHVIKSKKEKEKEKKEEKEREKAQRKAEKEQREKGEKEKKHREKEEKEKENGVLSGSEGGGISRFRVTSKSMKKPQWLGKDREKEKKSVDISNDEELPPLPPTPGLHSVERKKSLSLPRKSVAESVPAVPPMPVALAHENGHHENGQEHQENGKDNVKSGDDTELETERENDGDETEIESSGKGRKRNRFRLKDKSHKSDEKPNKHHHRPSLLTMKNMNLGLRRKPSVAPLQGE